MDEAEDALLFSYGTLQDDRVQLACFGRRFAGMLDVITGYTRSSIEISSSGIDRSTATSYPILDPTGDVTDEVIGRVFRVTGSELASADEYEGPDYRRGRVRLKSGSGAWIYVKASTEVPKTTCGTTCPRSSP